MQSKPFRSWLIVLAVGLALAVGLVGGLVLDTERQQGVSEPQTGTVNAVRGPHTFYAPGSGITETAYTASPRTEYGEDVSVAWLYNAVDVFVTADVSGTDTLTVTPQFSADAANWADAYFETVSGTTVTAQTYRAALSTDGTAYLRLPVAGKYMRFKVETSGTVTPTIRALFKNN